MVRGALLYGTLALIASIVWFPSSVNGLDFLLYAGLWGVGVWALRAEKRERRQNVGVDRHYFHFIHPDDE